ncbi:MAG: H-NS histone family protein [Rhodocyclaceae bacterium]|jgi:DNA-binding protein H-NS|nr:H-NS histone family protein [Rhodocyclaceae bacterium]
MDLSKISIAELQSMLEKIPAEIEKRKAEEKQKVLDQIAALASSHGFSLDELISRKASAGKKSGTRKPVAVKYRHPQNPDLTWTGRGRKPAWVNDWLNGGKTVEGLLV